jgi:hypothetical protein
MRPRIPPDYRRVSVARERSAEYRLGACSHFTHRNPTDEFPAPQSTPGDPARPACGGKIREGSQARTLRGIAASRHPARSSRLSDGRTATASRIRDGRPKAAFTARPPDPGTVKHSDGCRQAGSQATAVTATHGPSLPRAASRLLGMRRATRIAPASRRGPSSYALRDAARWLASIASQPHQRPVPALRAAPPACAGHAVRMARAAGAPHSDAGKPSPLLFRMLTPLRPFHPSATVTGWTLRTGIRGNSTVVFRLRS